MMRRKFFLALRFVHIAIDRLMTAMFGLGFRQRYIRFSYQVKARLFPEYGSFVPEPSEIRSPCGHDVWLPPPIPEWVLSEMRDLGREIDPALFPSDAFIASCRFYSFPVIPRPGAVYRKLLTECASDRYSHCFAIPWLKRGGADLVSLRHIEFASRLTGGKVLVILTEPGDSPWLEKLPNSVDVIDASRYVSEISHEEFLQVLARILVQLDVEVLHIINSRHAWEAIEKYGLAIRQRTRIFGSIYCDDIDPYGQPVGFARTFLANCYKHLSAVFCDNTAFPTLLQRTYGYPRDLFVLLKTPIDAPCAAWSEGTQSSISRSVLWAGRLDRQKRPDLLLAIATAMPDVSFHVYGDAVLESSSTVLGGLRKAKNVIMKGGFDGSENLPFSEFPVFLYTSGWDGMPTIVLAAALAGIPIVASIVGGVGDVVTADSGFPIKSVDDVSEYVQAINFVLERPHEARNRAARAKEYVTINHSKEAFDATLRATSGYVTPSSASASGIGTTTCAH